MSAIRSSNSIAYVRNWKIFSSEMDLRDSQYSQHNYIRNIIPAIGSLSGWDWPEPA